MSYRSFECKTLKRIIKVSSDAIPNDECGWICDCGKWTGGKKIDELIEKIEMLKHKKYCRFRYWKLDKILLEEYNIDIENHKCMWS